MEERVKKEKEKLSKEEQKSVISVINREVSQMFTKGTHFKLNSDPKSLLG